MAKKKCKTRKTVKERFKLTKRGKVLHKKGSISHRKSKERSSTKSRGKGEKGLAKVERKRVRELLGR